LGCTIFTSASSSADADWVSSGATGNGRYDSSSG
jgi:hypothetical protein